MAMANGPSHWPRPLPPRSNAFGNWPSTLNCRMRLFPRTTKKMVPSGPSAAIGQSNSPLPAEGTHEVAVLVDHPRAVVARVGNEERSGNGVDGSPQRAVTSLLTAAKLPTCARDWPLASNRCTGCTVCEMLPEPTGRGRR